MNNEELVFNPEMPLAHYEKGHGIYLNYKNAVSFGTAMSIIAFIVGFTCILLAPAAMAVFFLMAVPFTLLAIIGCQARRPKMCIFSVPLALVAGIASVVAGSAVSILGLIAYVIAAFAVFRAAHAISNLTALKDLPGFPMFDASLDNISFAAMDEMGADELFSDEPVVYEEVHGKRFIAPMDPSEVMDEILTEGTAITEEEKKLTAYEREIVKEVSDVPEDLRDEVAQSLGHLAPNLAEYEEAAANEREENSDRAYEKMIKIQQGKNNNNISDVDLLG